jgi:Ni,Fe-hydrogenase maturation factor
LALVGAAHEGQSTSQREEPVSTRVLIPGFGTVLWAGEGFGIRCAAAMVASHALPPEGRLLDGGTQDA